MSNHESTYGLRVTGPAERQLNRLPEGTAAAIVEFMLGALVDNPQRLGAALQRELFGLRSVRRGAAFVATNTDASYPGTHRVLPGAGSLVAAVAVASGRDPIVAGKPEVATVALVRERFGTNGIMVGDRPSTDGVLAQRLGWPFAMVLSGIGGHDPNEPVPVPAPQWVTADLAGLAALLVGSS